MKTKRISELTQLKSLTDNTRLVVEDDGETKLVSPDAIGKVKTVNNVEPDENGNVKIDFEEEMLRMISKVGVAKFASEDGETLYIDNEDKVFTL